MIWLYYKYIKQYPKESVEERGEDTNLQTQKTLENNGFCKSEGIIILHNHRIFVDKAISHEGAG